MARTEATPPGSVSMTKWRVGKDRKDGSITVEMTFSDPAEARAWSTWLLDRDTEREAEAPL